MTKDALKKNFWELSNLDKAVYLAFIRPFQPRSERIFFDGSFLLPGQMYKAERKALYDIIRETKPDYCFEIGTYTGGGSTFFISRGLRDNNKGKLITTESDGFLYNKAKDRYRKFIRSQFPFIDFVHGSSTEAFKGRLMDANKKILIFLDGAEDGEQTLEQYEFFKPHMRSGSILALHDWNTEKTIRVKPVLTSDKSFTKLLELDKPDSVGFAVFRKN